MRTSILVPAYNELKTLPLILEKLSKLDIDKEVIIVDDGSEDGSEEWVKKTITENRYPYEIRFIKHSRNMGKGKALITALNAAKGEISVIQDADLEYDPKYIKELVRLIEKDGFAVVYGSRLLSGESETYSLLYLWGNKFLTFLNNLLFGGQMTDSYTGYKAFRTEVLKKLNLTSTGFEIEAEISAKVSIGKYKFKEIPIVYFSRDRKAGKKINYKDAVKGVLKIIEICLSRKKIKKTQKSS